MSRNILLYNIIMSGDEKSGYIESLRHEISESAGLTRDSVVKVEEAYESFLAEFSDLDAYIHNKKRDLERKEGVSHNERSLAQQYHDLNTTIAQFFSEGLLKDFNGLKFAGKDRFIGELDEAGRVSKEGPDKLNKEQVGDISAGLNSDLNTWFGVVEDRAVSLAGCFRSSDRIVREMEALISFNERHEPDSPILSDLREIYDKFSSIRDAVSNVRDVTYAENSPGVNAIGTGNKCSKSLYALVSALYA